MGCCFSRDTGADSASPYPPVSDAQTQAPDSSSRNITASSPLRAGSLASPRGSHASRTHSHPQAENRPNVPLKLIDPKHRSKLPHALVSPTVGSHRAHATPLSDSIHDQWTRSRLEKERNDWWDTRTTGSQEIWSALRIMVESLQKGDVAEAQALLDATECTCPNGQLWKGIFDAHGEWYRVPEWIVIEPEGLVEEEEEAKDDDAEVDDKQVEEESVGEPVQVRCRLSSTAQDVMVGIRRGERVGKLVGELKAKAGINPFAIVRIVYGGKIYDEHATLESNPMWRYESKHVLIAMVFE